MPIFDLLKLALETFRTHRMRSFLTVLGIIIGVMTVIAIVSLIQGMNYEVERQISTLGSNTIYVQKIAWGMGQLDFDELSRRPELTLEDAEAISHLPSVARVAPQRSRQVNRITRQGEKVTNIALLGSTPAIATTANYRIETGRFISSEDSLRKRAVCVLGPYIVDNLFINEDPIGKSLVIEGKRFTVIGILERKGSFLGQSQDNIIIVPLSTYEKSFPEPRSRQARLFGGITIGVVPKAGASVEQTIDEVRELLRRRRGLGYDKPDNFAINTQETLREIYKNITRVAFIVMIVVAGISLLVGGIGIMNIMLVAVAERTREIGLRKALGATNSIILWQFLLESTLMTLVGGVIGIMLGLGVAQLAATVGHLKAAAPIWTILLGFGFSAAVGIFFGIFPASRAARLNPIQALRYE